MIVPSMSLTVISPRGSPQRLHLSHQVLVADLQVVGIANELIVASGDVSILLATLVYVYRWCSLRPISRLAYNKSPPLVFIQE